jgi:hypothetical protein
MPSLRDTNGCWIDGRTAWGILRHATHVSVRAREKGFRHVAAVIRKHGATTLRREKEPVARAGGISVFAATHNSLRATHS